MNVSRINNKSLYNNNAQSFKGLLHEGTPKTLCKQHCIEYCKQIDIYHPFKDESLVDIAKKLEEYTFSKTEKTEVRSDGTWGGYKTTHHKAKLGETLPFNLDAWKQYETDKYAMRKVDRVWMENRLHGVGLEEYIKFEPLKYLKSLLRKLK